MSALVGLTFTLLALVGAIRVVRCTLATARAIPGALRRALASLGRALARLDDSAPTMARAVSSDDVASIATLARQRGKRAA